MSRKTTFWSLMGLLVILSMIISACGGPAPTELPATEAPPATDGPVRTQEAPVLEPPSPVMPGGELEKALGGAYTGTTVPVAGPFTAPDDQLFFESMAAFEEATGIKVNYLRA